MEYPSIQPVPQTTAEAPTTPVDAKVSDEPTVVTHEKKERPPSLSEVPLITKLLEINDDHFNIPEDTKFLNEFILSEMKRQDLDDSEESYKSVLDFLTKKTNVPDGLDLYSKLSQLVEYAKIQEKLYGIMEEREKFLSKKPEDMTSKELKRFIEGK